jgi:hypothetical protein
MASSVNNSAWLEWMTTLMRESSQGGVSRHTHAATLPPDRFYCLLDELPLHLIPRRAFRSFELRNLDQTLFLNPACIICAAGELPEELELEKERLAGFALETTIAWVRDSATGSLLPFWLGPRLEDAVRDLKRGEPVPRTLQGDARTWLSAAGILTSADYATRRLREWGDAVEKSGPVFRKKGYAPIADLIHPFHLGALRRYYRHLIRTGAIQLGDGQSPRRYVAYNEPVAKFFHHQIAAMLSAVAGEPLKPSYVYFASYLSGAELKKHTDREQCEFSVTLCLDFSPEPELETPWPIRLDTPGGTATVYQALGDALAYRGTRLPHDRDCLGDGQTSTSIFFHYVPADFAGTLD